MNPKHLIIITAIVLLMCSGTASAWLSGYDHRISTTVNNGGASTLNYYQFNFTNDTNTLVAAGHMQASGADCRITDASDNLIPFWNETAFNVAGTKIWANATTLAVGDNTFYMYYGNAAASSVVDISGTFVFGDNFSVGPPVDAWTRYAGNPIISTTSGQWDYGFQVKPSAIYQGSEYKLYYYGATDDPNNIPRKIGMANGTDGYSFTKQGVVFSPSVSGWDNQSVMDPSILYHNSEYWLYYGGQNPNEGTVTGEARTGLAKSADGATFTRITNGIGGTSKVLDLGGTGEWDHNVALGSSCVYYNGYFWLYYWGRPANANDNIAIGLAKSTDGVSFTKITNGIGGTSKVLESDGSDAEGKGLQRPSVFRYDNEWHMFVIRSHTDNSKRVGYAYSTNGVDWTRSSNNPVLDIGTATWEDDYLPAVSVIFKEGNENNKCIMYYQGAYTSTKPTNRLAIANQTTTHDWDSATDCKWTFSSTDAITIESGVMKVKAVTGGQHADVKTAYKPNFTEMDYDFVQEFDYKPTAGYTHYGVTSIGTQQQTSYAGGDNSIFIWHYGGTSDGGQHFRWRSNADATSYDGTNIAPYATNELYKFQAKKLAGNAVCKIWDTSHSETSPNVENTLTAKDNYNFPYVTVWTRSGYTQPAVEIDNYRIRKLVSPEPTSSLGAEESAPSVEYQPPTPTSLANTTGNFWVNHTWSAGSGNVTDSYNVSVNTVWYNNTAVAYNNTTSSAHAWANITVYAFNTSGTGTLSAASTSQDTQIPNNAITITNTSDWSGSSGSNVYVDYDATDADSDTPTFSCNRTDLFTDFSTSTGKGNWTATAGTYYVDFGVSDGYSSTSNYTMTITGSALNYTPPNPTTLANTTGNFWVNHTWSAGSGNVTDSYNVSQNGTWHNTTTTPHFNATSVGAHGYSDLTVYAFNSSSTGTLSAGNITQNTTVPNNAITITNTSDWSGSSGSNVYVDYDATDADSDTPTFSCNRTDLFTDFSTSTGKGNWTATTGTYYVDFGVSDGYGSTSNYTMIITGSAIAPIITLLSQNPSTIFQNTTGYLNISYGISHDSAGLNNTSVSFIFRNYDHTLSDANHSIRPPANDKCEMWNFDGQIMRGANRNETLNFENNDTITGGDIFTWSGLDENNTRLIIVPINSTYTVVHINGTIHDLAMEQMWYLDRADMVEAPKTQLAIHKTQDVVIKFWDAEIFKGNYDFIGMGYTDTSLESSPAAHPSDANPVSFYYLNSSYNPLGGVDPLDSAVFMGSLNATQWVDHVYSPGQNASYVRGAINNTLLNSVINTTEISYLYFRSNTPSSKPFYINITDSSTNTNRTFGQTDVLWIGDAAPYTAHPYTPNVWFAFVYDNTSFDHKLYVADNNGKWGNGTLQSTNIGAGLFPPTKPSISHFHFNGSDDYDINKTYSGTIEVHVGVGTDPDGGTVTHNLTLHYKNQTLVAIINNTFTDADIIGNGVYAEISFNTTPYYSETEEYTLRVIATDDEGETSESWSCCNFTLGTHQISNLHTTTLVYNRIVWEWVNPDYYDTIMVYLDNVWKQNTTGTYYSASSLSQQTAYTIKLITVYAGVESDPATDTQVIPAEQGGSGGGGGDTTPAPTPTATATATATITPLPDENVTENVSIAIEPIPDITIDIVMNETITATVWHLSFEKHGVYIPYQQNIVACTAIPPYACRYYEDQKKFEIVIDGESQNPIFTADQWVTFITRDGERISQHIQTKVYNPLFYLTFTPTSASVTGVMRYFVHGDENTMDGIRVWWLGLLGMGLIAWAWRRKK